MHGTEEARLTVQEELLLRIADRTARVAIIGLGYVGLPLALEFAQAGFRVTGIDVDADKCALVNAGKSYVGDVPAEAVAEQVRAGRLHATPDYAALDEADACIICVPTPLNKTKDPDISYILAAADGVSEHMHAGMLVVLESTTYPGTTDEVLRPRIERNGFTVGRELFLAFSPERVDPGNKVWKIHNTPKVVGGATPACQTVASALYSAIVQRVVPVSGPAAAEMVKLLENTFRAVNIGLVNEMAQICHRLDVDIWEVVEAAATKPFGYMPFYPGPGLGGHCIPVDPLYLTWRMRGLGVRTRFIELADSVNSAMPGYVVQRTQDALNDLGKPLKGARILILGVSYKADVSDLRESPALTIIEDLLARRASVVYNDPHVPHLALGGGERLESTALTAGLLHEADCVVIHTAHSAYDWAWIAEHARLVIDTRGVVPLGYGAQVQRL